jgi:xanthine dehydrogenase molybdopterin-binding subunit B
VPRLLSDCRRDSRYGERRAEVDRFNKEHKWRKRGIVLVPTKFGVRIFFISLPSLTDAIPACVRS